MCLNLGICLVLCVLFWRILLEFWMVKVMHGMVLLNSTNFAEKKWYDIWNHHVQSMQICKADLPFSLREIVHHLGQVLRGKL